MKGAGCAPAPFAPKRLTGLCAPVQPGVLHAGGLAGSELVVTGVEGVVHVVVDRVETRLRAGVLTLRAAEPHRTLAGRRRAREVPISVDGAVDPREREAEAGIDAALCSAEAGVHDPNLLLDLGQCDVA